MFKPQTFQFENSIHWPGTGPTNEISAYHIEEVISDGDGYIFKHASGYAVKVPKSSVTSHGIFDSDDIPNLPSKDDKDADKPANPPGTRTPLPGPVEVPQVPVAPNAGGVEIIPPKDAAADESKPSVPEDVDNGDTSTEPKSDAVSTGSDAEVPAATETVPSAPEATEGETETDIGTDDAKSQPDVAPVDSGSVPDMPIGSTDMPSDATPVTDTLSDAPIDEAAKTDGNADDADKSVVDAGSNVVEPSADKAVDEAADDDIDATDDQSSLSDVLGDMSMKSTKKTKKSKK